MNKSASSPATGPARIIDIHGIRPPPIQWLNRRIFDRSCIHWHNYELREEEGSTKKRDEYIETIVGCARRQLEVLESKASLSEELQETIFHYRYLTVRAIQDALSEPFPAQDSWGYEPGPPLQPQQIECMREVLGKLSAYTHKQPEAALKEENLI